MPKYDGKVVISTELDNSQIPKGVNEVKGSLGGLKNVVKSLGSAIAAAFSIAAIVSFTKECIELGSSLEEVQNVVDVSFGSMSKAMEEFADNALMQFGISELAAKQTGSTYMAMAKGMGVAEKTAAEMSLTLTGLSGDVASFYNLHQEVAAKKLQGIFTGESEALKELGVVMTQTNLKQYALEHGMNANIEAMSQAEQVALRYAFVTDALSLAQGDFVRTQDSWANQTRILTEQWKQFMSIIGQSLTTVLVPVVKMLNTVVSALIRVAKAIQSVVGALFGGSNSAADASESIGGVSDAFVGAAGGAEEFGDATAAAAKKAKKALAGFDEITKLGSTDSSGSGSSSGNISAGSTDLGAGLTFGSDEPIEDKLSPQVQALVDKVLSYIEPLKNIDLTPAMNSFSRLGTSIGSLGSVFGEHLEWAWFNILVPLSKWTIEEGAPAAVDLLSAAFVALTAFLAPVYAGFRKLMEYLQPAFAFMGDVAVGVLQKLESYFLDLAGVFEEKAPEIAGLISGIGEIFSIIWPHMKQQLSQMFTTWSNVFSGLGTITNSTIGFIVDILYGLTEFIAGTLTGDWKRAWSGIVKIFEGAGENMMGTGEGVLEMFGVTFEDIQTVVKNAINGIIGFTNGLTSAITTGMNAVIKALNKISIKIPDWLKYVPGAADFAGKSIGFNIKTLTTPKIPYLAQGAVLPANKPFLAMVGDQKHGTNVEAPLATIQEAVALVMEEYAAANLAGHEATVAVLRDILEAVLGIEIGDSVIGAAAARYNARMNIVRGGAR